MDYNEIQQDKVNASVINVETLQKEYEVVLQKYQEAVQNYISTLQNTDTKNIQFEVLKGRTWWGTGALEEAEVSTQEECEAMCANNSKCSGATFNPVKRYCWTRQGDAPVSAGVDDDYALIPKQKAALYNMKTLNEQLLSLNTQITNELKNNSSNVELTNQENNLKKQQLDKSFKELLGQKSVMEQQLNEYYSIQQDNDNQSLFVNRKAMLMRLWTLIAAVVILITMKNMYGDDSPPIFFTAGLIILIVLILITVLFN